jgi:hypothetical protein
LHHAVQDAKHYMSGRQHVVLVQPTTGALWCLPGVQKGIEQHAQQADDLLATLRSMEQSQAAEADARAAGLALQLAATQPSQAAHDESELARVNVKQHIHNFSCHIPSQLDTQGRWRCTFVDTTRLVPDPKRELAV